MKHLIRDFQDTPKTLGEVPPQNNTIKVLNEHGRLSITSKIHVLQSKIPGEGVRYRRNLYLAKVSEKNYYMLNRGRDQRDTSIYKTIFPGKAGIKIF